MTDKLLKEIMGDDRKYTPISRFSELDDDIVIKISEWYKALSNADREFIDILIHDWVRVGEFYAHIEPS